MKIQALPESEWLPKNFMPFISCCIPISRFEILLKHSASVYPEDGLGLASAIYCQSDDGITFVLRQLHENPHGVTTEVLFDDADPPKLEILSSVLEELNIPKSKIAWRRHET